jgi:NADH dehydrogenase
VLYNTYWVRFNHGTFSFAQAVANSRVLFEAARAAGVERVVHVSITNPERGSRLGYFAGKAEVEEALRAVCGERDAVARQADAGAGPSGGTTYAILRPAVLFGGRDILINNIAWMLRRLPVFGVFGDGTYRLQPIHVEDFAALAVAQGSGRGNVVVQAIGPETLTYRGLVETIARALGLRRRIVAVPPLVGYALGKVAGWVTGDVTITRDEIEGLMEGKLYVDAPPAGTTKLTAWAREQRGELGRHYASELARR